MYKRIESHIEPKSRTIVSREKNCSTKKEISRDTMQHKNEIKKNQISTYNKTQEYKKECIKSVM